MTLSSYNPAMRIREAPPPVDEKALIMGATLRATLPCEAHCFCVVSDTTVWVSERSGAVSVRNSKNGDVLHCIETGVRAVHANVMRQIGNYVFAGDMDGRLCVFDIQLLSLIAELRCPEVEHPGAITDIVSDGSYVFTSTASARVDVWEVRTQSHLRSLQLRGPVAALLLVGPSLIAGDGSGRLTMFDAATLELLCTNSDTSVSAVTALCHESTTNTVWAARENFSIDVYSATHLRLVDTIRDNTGGKLTSLLCVGGKVWGGGYSRTVFVWHALNRRLIGSFKDHTAFIAAMGKVFVSETARIWTVSNDKKINIYDGEGFFQPVRGVPSEAEQHTLLNQLVQQLRIQNAGLLGKIATMESDSAAKDADMDVVRSRNADLLGKIAALEGAIGDKELDTHAKFMDAVKLQDEITKLSNKNGELATALGAAEREKTDLRADLTRLQADLTRLRTDMAEKVSKFTAVGAENVLLEGEKQRLKAQLGQREGEIEALQSDLKKARDDAHQALADRNKHDLEKHGVMESMRRLQEEAHGALEKARSATDIKKSLDETIMLRDAEIKRLREELAKGGHDKTALHQQIAALQAAAEEEREKIRKLQDMHALRNNETEVLRQERDSLRQQLDFEKAHTHEARNNEAKLRLQLDELRRQLEAERSNVKMLRDQYTIFQFVINSRGELVQHIWALHNKVQEALRGLGLLDTHIREFDSSSSSSASLSTSMGGGLGASAQERMERKRDWRANVVDRSRATVAALADCHKQSHYVVCNYLSDYEKMHLGISTSQHLPDSKRPPIVGDELLMKLRDVTLPKQYVSTAGVSSGPDALLPSRSVNSTASASGLTRPHTSAGHSVRGALPKPLPAPYNPALGPHHNVSLTENTFCSVRPATAM